MSKRISINSAPTRAKLVALVDEFCSSENLLSPGDTIVIGLSGGPDSVLLLHVLHELATQYQLHLIAAHLDHGWRAESAQDVQFCRDLCKKLDVTFVAGHAWDIETGRKPTGSKEEEGRQLRRAFFEKIAREHGAHKIALAHHKDDLIETFFIRLLRGAGISGLASIRPHQGQYIRPLLAITKDEILTYLNEHTIPYLIDSTNTSVSHLRNRIREYLIPALKKTDARADVTVVRAIEHLRETEEFLEQLTTCTFERVFVTQDGRLFLNVVRFRNLEPFLQKRVVLEWFIRENVPFTPTTSFFDEVLKFVRSGSGGKHQLHTTWRIEKKGPWAWIKIMADHA